MEFYTFQFGTYEVDCGFFPKWHTYILHAIVRDLCLLLPLRSTLLHRAAVEVRTARSFPHLLGVRHGERSRLQSRFRLAGTQKYHSRVFGSGCASSPFLDYAVPARKQKKARAYPLSLLSQVLVVLLLIWQYIPDTASSVEYSPPHEDLVRPTPT